MEELEEYFVQFQQELYYYLFRRVRKKEDCEDLLQEVYLKAFLAFPSQKIENVGAWLKTIAKYTMIDYYRSQKKISFFTEEVEDSLLATHDLVKHYELQEVLQQIAKLPVVYRNALILIAVKGFSYEEAGDILRIPPNTLKSQVKRGRKLLKERLEKEGDTSE